LPDIREQQRLVAPGRLLPLKKIASQRPGAVAVTAKAALPSGTV
jgi:hypothetical protein